MSRPAAARLLAALGAALGERGLRWYVFGAQAVVVHGRPRMTADVDATVELVGASKRELLDGLERHGFELRLPLSDELLAELQLLPLVHAVTEMPLDLVIAVSGLQIDFLERARPVDVGGVVVPVVSAADLVAMKVLAGRRKDLEDVRGVLVEQRGRIDITCTREVLGAIEEALGERRLLPRLERLVRAADKEATSQERPESGPRGRGRRRR